VGSEFFPDWSKLFAMSAPWGIVLNEDILGWVLNDRFEFLSDNDLNWSVVACWDFLSLEIWLNLSCLNVINEVANDVNGQVSSSGLASVFLHVSWQYNSKSWEVCCGNTHEFGESLLDSSTDIRVSEKHLTFVGFGGLFESSLECGLAVFFVRSEQNDGWLLLSENGFNLILSEFENSWYHQWLNKFDH